MTKAEAGSDWCNKDPVDPAEIKLMVCDLALPLGRKRSRFFCEADITVRQFPAPAGKLEEMELSSKLIMRSVEPQGVNITHNRHRFREQSEEGSLWGTATRSSIREYKRKKSVRFAKGAKSWDGVANTQGKRDFDDLLFHFFVRREKVGDADIINWTRGDLKRVDAMRKLLLDLRHRISSAGSDSLVPCLPQGGGKSIRLQAEHLPYLTSLNSVLDEAVRALNQRSV